MKRNRSIPVLLAVAMIAQSVIAGWGHWHRHDGHTHLGHVHAAHGQIEYVRVGKSKHHHSHDSGHSHSHTYAVTEDQSPHEHLPPHDHDDDCSICRHLALAAVLTLELESPKAGDSNAAVFNTESLLTSATAGLYRPRAPPAIS